MATKIVHLQPIREPTKEAEALEARIREHLRREIYLPLLKLLGEPHNAIKNAAAEDDELLDALFSGRITFYRGTFSGRFNATITERLRSMGAKWDRRAGTFKVPLSALPISMRSAIAASEFKFKQKLDSIDKKLAQILPDDVAAKLKTSDLFDRTIWKVDRDFHSSVRGIALAPNLSPEQRKRIAAEWANNMELHIKEFTEKEIGQLRKQMQASVFSGGRYQSALKTIQASYGVTANKAKFLASQETRLLTAKFAETRYADAGITEYTWYAVAGSANHPVRKIHQELSDEKGPDGKKKIRRFDDPPITDEAGNRNNPREDYNCRCYARPVVRFKK